MKKGLFLLMMSLLLVACSDESKNSNENEKGNDTTTKSEEVTTVTESKANADDAKKFIEEFYSLLNNKEYSSYAALIDEEKIQKYQNITRDNIAKNWEEKVFKENIESIESLVSIENVYDENTYFYKVVLKYSNGNSEEDYGVAFYQDGEWAIDLTGILDEIAIDNIAAQIGDAGTFETQNGYLIKLANNLWQVIFDFKINSQYGISFGWTDPATFLAKTSVGEEKGQLNRDKFAPNTSNSYLIQINGQPETITISNVYLTNNGLAIPGQDPVQIVLPIKVK